MVAELSQYGELTMKSLVEAVGNDKSQVSRALNRLLTVKVVQRESLRSALSLTAAGKVIAQKLHAGSRYHYQKLVKGLNRGEQDSFMTGISHLTQVATRLLEDERRLEARHERADGRKDDVSKLRPAFMSGAMLPEMLPARLIALATLLQRSSFLAFNRLTNLSNNESTVLAYVWQYAPITAKQLTQLTGRTKARIERTAAALAQFELVQRRKTPASHDWVFDRADAGSGAYTKLAAEINRREELLIQDFSAQELTKFRALLGRVVANASSIEATGAR